MYTLHISCTVLLYVWSCQSSWDRGFSLAFSRFSLVSFLEWSVFRKSFSFPLGSLDLLIRHNWIVENWGSNCIIEKSILSSSAFNSLLFSDGAMVILLFGLSCLHCSPSYAWGFSDLKMKLFHTYQHPHFSTLGSGRHFKLNTVPLLCGIQLAPTSRGAIQVLDIQHCV